VGAGGTCIGLFTANVYAADIKTDTANANTELGDWEFKDDAALKGLQVSGPKAGAMFTF